MARHSRQRDRIEAFLARIVLGTLEFTPLPVAKWLGLQYGLLLDRLVPRLRHIAHINLSFAYPENDGAWRDQIVDEVFASVGRILVALARFPKIDRTNVSAWIRYEGFEHYQIAKQRGRGILFATAHLGNWELSAFAHALLTEPMNVIVRPLDNTILDDIVERRRSLSGNHLLSKRDFVRQILQALKKNDAVGILMDQNTGPENGAFVPFFGKLACANTTFAKLAARSGAAVIPGFATWSERENLFILKFYPLVEITGDLIADTAVIQAAIETAVRETPGQWLWIHRRWKNRPPGEPPLY